LAVILEGRRRKILEAENMKEQLKQWAESGDGDSMYKLSKIYQAEKDFSKYQHWLEKSAETKNFFAMKELADNLRKQENINAAREIYKEIIEISGDWRAMENLLDISANDTEILEFILSKIESMYNEIYLRNYQILRRTWALGTRRHNECTIQYLATVERRRIASRIRKLLAEN
jgi:lipopolysaccharide biosynthesis regulator YciM